MNSYGVYELEIFVHTIIIILIFKIDLNSTKNFGFCLENNIHCKQTGYVTMVVFN